MAFALTWKVEFGDCTGLTDITSYVMSLNITSDAQLGKMGRASASVTINNNGGQFTPQGTGTYGSTDWFAKALVITSTSGANTGTSFVGMISEIDTQEVSSKESYFTIQGLDWVSVAGRSSTKVTGVVGGTPYEMISRMLTQGTPFSGQPNRSTMGASPFALCDFVWDEVNGIVGGTDFINLPTKYPNYGTNTFFFIGDAINNVALASFPSTMYSTSFTRTSALWTWGYNFQYVGNKTANKNEFVFKGDGTALTSGQLPFDNTHVGYQTDVLINDAVIGSEQSTVGTSQNKYGARTVTYTNPGTTTTSDFTIAAFNWAQRYSTIRYVPDNLTVDYSSLRGSAVDDGVAMLQFMYLLWPKYSLWNRYGITVKGAGQTSSTTYQVVGTKTVVAATPSDTSVTVSLVSGADNQSFTLDSSTYGILDTNRLG